MKKKFKHGFLGCIHCFILALPILFVLYYVLVNFNDGFTAITGSESLNFDSSNLQTLEEIHQYVMNNYTFTFNVVNFDFMSIFGVDDTNYYIQFVNWYLNYLINMELVLFLPEILLIVLTMAKRLVLSWSNKIGESY